MALIRSGPLRKEALSMQQGKGHAFGMPLQPGEQDTPTTKTDRAVRALREAIQRGEIRQGEHLSVTALAAQLQMSPTPVREAVRILQTEGLIELTPHHALTVTQTTEMETEEPTNTGISRFTLGEPHQTKTELAVQAIRDAILRGTIPAGEQLTVGELAQQLSMSPTPVREAIRILQVEGLLHQTPHHTISAIAFTEQDIVDIFDLRAVLESLATRLAAPHFSDVVAQQLEAIHAQMQAAQRAEAYTTVHRLNADWHLTIYQVSHNKILVETIQSLWHKFLWESLWSVPAHTERSLEQHRAIMRALRAGNGEQAAELMRIHMDHGKETGVRYFRQRQAERAKGAPPITEEAS